MDERKKFIIEKEKKWRSEELKRSKEKNPNKTKWIIGWWKKKVQYGKGKRRQSEELKQS